LVLRFHIFFVFANTPFIPFGVRFSVNGFNQHFARNPLRRFVDDRDAAIFFFSTVNLSVPPFLIVEKKHRVSYSIGFWLHLQSGFAPCNNFRAPYPFSLAFFVKRLFRTRYAMVLLRLASFFPFFVWPSIRPKQKIRSFLSQAYLHTMQAVK